MTNLTYLTITQAVFKIYEGKISTSSPRRTNTFFTTKMDHSKVLIIAFYNK